jgi:hypothetical protein
LTKKLRRLLAGRRRVPFGPAEYGRRPPVLLACFTEGIGMLAVLVAMAASLPRLSSGRIAVRRGRRKITKVTFVRAKVPVRK